MLVTDIISEKESAILAEELGELLLMKPVDNKGLPLSCDNVTVQFNSSTMCYIEYKRNGEVVKKEHLCFVIDKGRLKTIATFVGGYADTSINVYMVNDLEDKVCIKRGHPVLNGAKNEVLHLFTKKQAATSYEYSNYKNFEYMNLQAVLERFPDRNCYEIDGSLRLV